MNKNVGHVYLQFGFTLIELIVVIAIIGLLSAVVVSALTSARNKGKDSTIKSALIQARNQADIFYTTGNTYVGVCTSGNDTANPKGIYGMILSAATVSGLSSINVNNVPASGSLTTATCNTDGTNWAAEVPLKYATGLWCVDSGRKGEVNATSIGAGVVCP